MESLPDCLLSHILSFLPIKQAVRSCLLSSRWKFLWKFITQLDFDDDDDLIALNPLDRVARIRLESHLKALALVKQERWKRFTIFAKEVLSQLDSLRIHKFGLKLDSVRSILTSDSDLNPWFLEFVGRTIEELHLSFRYGSISEKLNNPTMSLRLLGLIHHKTLAVLKLNGITCFDISELPSSVCFPSLHTLHLSRTKYSLVSTSHHHHPHHHCFPKLKILHLESLTCTNKRVGGGSLDAYDQLSFPLLTSSPLLTELVIIRGKGQPDEADFHVIRSPTLKSLKIVIRDYTCSADVELFGFQIDAPSLLCLEVWIHDLPSTKKKKPVFEIKNTSSIIKAAIHLSSELMSLPISCDAFYQLINSLSNVEHLSFLVGTLEALSKSSVYSASADHMPLVFHRLTRLDLELEPDLFCWCRTVISLLREMDNLQLLVLKGCFVTYDRFDPLPSDWFEALPGSKCILPRLRQVKVTEISGPIGDLGLFRYILNNANQLELMTVNGSRYLDPDDKLELRRKLSMFSKLYPSCQIKFYDFINNPGSVIYRYY